MFDQIQRILATGRSSIHPTHFGILANQRISAMGRSIIQPQHFFQPRYSTQLHANAIPTINNALGSTYPSAAPSNERKATESFVITFTPQEAVTFLLRAKTMHLVIISRQCCGPLAENLRVRLPRDWDAGPQHKVGKPAENWKGLSLPAGSQEVHSRSWYL